MVVLNNLMLEVFAIKILYHLLLFLSATKEVNNINNFNLIYIFMINEILKNKSASLFFF